MRLVEFQTYNDVPRRVYINPDFVTYLEEWMEEGKTDKFTIIGMVCGSRIVKGDIDFVKAQLMDEE